jgi:cytochrome c2
MMKLPTTRRIAILAAMTASLAAAIAVGAAPAAKGTAKGNPANGKKAYAAQKCDMCHVINKQGNAIGPELSREGKKRDAAWLAAFLKSPKSKVPNSTMPAATGGDGVVRDMAAYLASLK